MTKKKKAKKMRLTGCPRCGGEYVKQAGLMICKKCGHNSMNLMGDAAYSPLHNSTGGATGTPGTVGGYRKRSTIYSGS